MMLYEIITDDGRGFATSLTRRRHDAATFQIQRTVYEVAGAYGLRDRPVAWNAVSKLNEAVQRRSLASVLQEISRTYKIGDTTITVIVSKA